jgi:hypothetical protein
MHKLWPFIIILCNLTSLAFTSPATNTQTGFQFENNQATLNFPESITFKAKITGSSEIERVILEYYTERISCGNVIAKGFPEIRPANSVEVQWTWEMLQSGSLPPGAKIHWRWHVFTKNGDEVLSNEKEVIWLDSTSSWKTISNDKVVLHWYSGGQTFGSALHAAALTALSNIEKQIGLKPNNPIDVYIYANNEDFQNAILYEPGWTGGLAIAEYDVVLIGIAPEDVEWGKTIVAHEIAHVLQGQYSFTCLGETPTWLVEGIAMYAEGGLDENESSIFDAAIRENNLISVRGLSGSFSENPDKADLSYSQSYSLVNFLIEQYGKLKLLDLMTLLSQGLTTDDALKTTYGFDIDGFEEVWRLEIGARPSNPPNATPIPSAFPTVVPTIIPLGSNTIIFTQTASDSYTEAPTSASKLLLPSTLLLAGGGVLLILLIITAVILVRKRRSTHE